MAGGWLFLPGGRGERGEVEKGKGGICQKAKGNLERQGGLQYFAREGKASTEGGTEGTSGDPASRQET